MPPLHRVGAFDMVTAKISYDSCYDVDDIIGDVYEFYSFSRRHKNFIHPDEAQKKFADKLSNGKAKFMGVYIHGNVAWALSGEEWYCQWDSVRHAGIVVYNGDDAPSDDNFRAAINMYNKVINGEVCVVEVGDECVGGVILDDESIRNTISDMGIDPSQVTFDGEAAGVMR